MACKCRDEAKKRGFAGFAMFYIGECYGRTESQIQEALSRQHMEHGCFGDQTYTKCLKGNHEHCTGSYFAEAVYSFKASGEESKQINLI